TAHRAPRREMAKRRAVAHTAIGGRIVIVELRIVEPEQVRAAGERDREDRDPHIRPPSDSPIMPGATTGASANSSSGPILLRIARNVPAAIIATPPIATYVM